MRVALGAAQRDDYTFFSAQEQAALWELRQSALASSQSETAATATQAKRLRASALQPAHHTARACRPSRTAKVIRRDGRMCAPLVDFAEAADWRDHLSCFDERTGDVR